MSIIISSDDNSNSSNDLPTTEFNKGSRKNVEDEGVMDLTQPMTYNKEHLDSTTQGCVDVDAMFDSIMGITVVKRTDSGISSGSGSNAIVNINLSEESSKAGLSRGRRRKSVGSTIEDKVVTKIAKTSAKDYKRQKLAEDKAAKKAASVKNKIYKPGECMKHMTVEMHPNLLSAWYSADVEREVTAGGARVEACDTLCDERLVLWSRSVPRELAAEDGQLTLTRARQRCAGALCVVPAAQAAERVAARALAPLACELRTLAGGGRLTIAVFGLKDYFKSSNRKNKKSSPTAVTEIEMEMAFADVLVSSGCDVAALDSPNELALLIAQLTKAIAEEPYKKQKRSCEEQAQFYMSGDNKRCVPVDRDGHGLSRLWQQMVAILPQSSLETARAVTAQYKSPLDLYEDLQTPDGETRLAAVGVSRAAVPGSKARRLGPEFARKMRILFTARDGSTLVD